MSRPDRKAATAAAAARTWLLSCCCVAVAQQLLLGRTPTFEKGDITNRQKMHSK